MGARTERHSATHDGPALSVPAQPYSKVHWCWHLTSYQRKKESEKERDGVRSGRVESKDSSLLFASLSISSSPHLSWYSLCLTVELEIPLSIACLIIRGSGGRDEREKELGQEEGAGAERAKTGEGRQTQMRARWQFNLHSFPSVVFESGTFLWYAPTSIDWSRGSGLE